MTITSGTLSYGRTVNLGDYSSHKAETVLSFTLPDGTTDAEANEYALKVGNLAQARTFEMLKLKHEGVTHAQAAVKTETAGPEDKKAKAASAKAAKEAAETTKAADPAPAPAKDEFAPEPEKTAEVDELAALPPDVTDEALVSAMTRTNGRIKNPVAIRQAVGKYVEFPKQAKDIPQSQRAAFLADLDKLQPAA